MVNLYLFDIDGTLVDMTNLHVAAYQAAYKSVLDLEVSRKALISKFGKIEKQIHIELFEELGVSGTDEINDIILKYESSILGAIEGVNVELLPGVTDFLQYLKNNKVYLGVVTGNPSLIGEAILEKTKLKQFFSIFSYGKVAKNREGIVMHAINEAKKKKYEFDKVIVIGDSPADVGSGKCAGAFTVGVATGHYDKSKLEKSGADIVLDNLTEYKKVLDALK